MSRRNSVEFYSRQQLGAAVAVGTEVLSYWLKGGLLRARNGEGGGKGVHRRFGYEAIHVAAILAELNRYGAGTATLGSIAAILWDAWSFGQRMGEFNESDVSECVSLVIARRRAVDDPAGLDEWFALRSSRSADIERVLKLEAIFKPEMELKFALYFDLFTYPVGEDLDTQWFAAPQGDGQFLIVPDATTFASAATERPSRITFQIERILLLAWQRLSAFDAATSPTRSPDKLAQGGHDGRS